MKILALGILFVSQAGGDGSWRHPTEFALYDNEANSIDRDEWVSCNSQNPATGQWCIKDHHTPINSVDPNLRRIDFSSSSIPSSFLDQDGFEGIGTQEFPAMSCADLALKSPHFKSGVYWLQPSLNDAPFQGFCEMESFGGGWHMCYTTRGQVHVSRETAPLATGAGYGSDGYRSDCRNYPFNQVMYVTHPTSIQEDVVPTASGMPWVKEVLSDLDKAWFSFRGRNALVISRSGYGGSVNETWAAGSGQGVRGLLFEAHASASVRSNACIRSIEGRNKVDMCPDCVSVLPQRGAPVCSNPDYSHCWCSGPLGIGTGYTAGCLTTPATSVYLAAYHEAVFNWYSGWILTITAGTGVGQQAMILSSLGGLCSDPTLQTYSSCVGTGQTWTSGANVVTLESSLTILPCSNSLTDGYHCAARCSPTYPADVTADPNTVCHNGQVYGTAAACSAACLSFDPYPARYSISGPLGADGGVTTLAAAVAMQDTAFVVASASGGGIRGGKYLMIDSEMMLVTSLSGNGNLVSVVRAVNASTAALHASGATVTVLTNLGADHIPTCTLACSTRYELRSPAECNPLEWACGYVAQGGPPRGYFPTGACTAAGATCTCTTLGAAACSAGALGGCGCAPFPSSDDSGARAAAGVVAGALSQPWNPVVFRLASGVDTDACSGPYHLCVGSNPYAGYLLRINGQTRTIIGWSGQYKVVQVDQPYTSTPVPLVAAYDMLLAPGCTGVYLDATEKAACAAAQLYQLMVCDKAPGHGLAGGFIMSGFAGRAGSDGPGCIKTCEDPTLCVDSETDWYRADAGVDGVTGTVFKANGLVNIPWNKAPLLSVGVRFVNNPPPSLS